MTISLRTRIALVGGLAVLLSLITASSLLYAVADGDLTEQLDSSLIETATTAPQLASKLDAYAIKEGQPIPPTTSTRVGDIVIQYFDASNQVGSPSSTVPLTAEDGEVMDGRLPAVFQTVEYQGQPYRMYTVQIGGAGEIVRVARPDADATGPLSRLRLLLELLVVGGMLVAVVIARLAAARVMRPVRTLTDTVERVTETGDLSVRMDPRGQDEIARLSRSFTAMMTALDTSVQAQRRLVADASHELRTPLTSLTTNLELLSEAGGLTDPQAPALLGAAREQAGELRMLVNDLVDLARYGEAEPHREDVRLDLITAQVAAAAAKRAPRLCFETDLTECLVWADPDAIERALGNLVDNAVKWSPEGGTIRVSVTELDGQARFEVADLGPGIADEDLPYVFDRFYRSAVARSKPGWGLGLSIVRQIADTHGGQVSAHPLAPEPGVRMRLSLPLVH